MTFRSLRCRRGTFGRAPFSATPRTLTSIDVKVAVGALREDQVAVAELVPEVAGVERLGVAVLEQLGAGDGLEQLQVRGLGLVPARDQPVDGPQAALRR